MKIESNQGMAYRRQVNEKIFNWRDPTHKKKRTQPTENSNNLANCNAEHVQGIYLVLEGLQGEGRAYQFSYRGVYKNYMSDDIYKRD